MLAGPRDHRHDQRGLEPGALEGDLLLAGLRIAGAKARGDQIGRLLLAGAGEQDEAPGRELAVIRHAGGDRQQILQRFALGAGRGQELRRHRAARLEQGQRVGHGDIRSEREMAQGPG